MPLPVKVVSQWWDLLQAEATSFILRFDGPVRGNVFFLPFFCFFPLPNKKQTGASSAHGGARVRVRCRFAAGAASSSMADCGQSPRPGSVTCSGQEAEVLLAPTTSPVLGAAEEALKAEPTDIALPTLIQCTGADILGSNAVCQPAIVVEVAEEAEQGFQSGLGIRKALRKHWGATVKLWDDGLKDLSEKVKSIKPDTPPAGDSSSPVLPADSGAPIDGVTAVEDAQVYKTEEAEQAAGAGGGGAEPDAVEHSPWSPVVRPLSKVMEEAKSMGVKLADIWDMHDILDDVKQQRDYWRRRREERRIKESAKGAEFEDDGSGATENSASGITTIAQSIIQDLVDDIDAASQERGALESGERIDEVPREMTHQDACHSQLAVADIPQVVPALPKKPGRQRHRAKHTPAKQADQDPETANSKAVSATSERGLKGQQTEPEFRDEA